MVHAVAQAWMHIQQVEVEFWRSVWNMVVFSWAFGAVIGGFVVLLGILGLGRFVR